MCVVMRDPLCACTPQLDAAAAKIASMEDMCKTYNKWQGLFG